MPEGKIKSKDLSYESTLPPFLQRLHAQKAGRGDVDRHEQLIARPKRSKAHEEEDEPTMVDEAGETISKAELEKLTAPEGGDVDGGDENVKTVGEESAEPKGSGAVQDGSQRVDQKVTDGTATKKRKAAKVVGEDQDDAPAQPQVHDESSPKNAVKKAKKKGKPIKLAFNDDEET
jgi:nucleoid-associated protein YgaU